MQNIAKTINNYLRGKIAGLVIYNDLFPADDTEGVTARHDPASRKEADFIDGSAVYSLNISYTARYNEAGRARMVLDRILEEVDGLRITDTEDGLLLKIKTVSNIQLIGIDDKTRTIYSASASVEYTKK